MDEQSVAGEDDDGDEHEGMLLSSSDSEEDMMIILVWDSHRIWISSSYSPSGIRVKKI